jgi:hypothetical protein
VAATGGTVILSGYIAAAALISFVTALFLWETYKVDLQAKLDSRAGPAHDREALREFAWTTEAGGWPSTCCLNPTGSVRTC